jgi:hypothetical protein
MGRLKLFRGDQILIPGIEVISFVETPKIDRSEKRKAKARKPRLQRPVQLSLLDLERSLSAKG